MPWSSAPAGCRPRRSATWWRWTLFGLLAEWRVAGRWMELEPKPGRIGRSLYDCMLAGVGFGTNTAALRLPGTRPNTVRAPFRKCLRAVATAVALFDWRLSILTAPAQILHSLARLDQPGLAQSRRFRAAAVLQRNRHFARPLRLESTTLPGVFWNARSSSADARPHQSSTAAM